MRTRLGSQSQMESRRQTISSGWWGRGRRPPIHQPPQSLSGPAVRRRRRAPGTFTSQPPSFRRPLAVSHRHDGAAAAAAVAERPAVRLHDAGPCQALRPGHVSLAKRSAVGHHQPRPPPPRFPRSTTARPSGTESLLRGRQQYRPTTCRGTTSLHLVRRGHQLVVDDTSLTSLLDEEVVLVGLEFPTSRGHRTSTLGVVVARADGSNHISSPCWSLYQPVRVGSSCEVTIRVLRGSGSHLLLAPFVLHSCGGSQSSVAVSGHRTKPAAGLVDHEHGPPSRSARLEGAYGSLLFLRRLCYATCRWRRR